MLIDRSLLSLLCLLLIVEVLAAAPSSSTTTKSARSLAGKKRTSRRYQQQRPFDDPTESLVIPVLSENDAEKILRVLGYNEVDDSDDRRPTVRISESTEQKLSDIIRWFQHDNDIPETGILDDETKLAIGNPHCGSRKKSSKRKGGGVSKWSKNMLSYRIGNFPQGKRAAPIRAVLARAFMEWSKVTKLDFVEVEDAEADIEINFGGLLHKLRNERCSFDDPKTLAHAFFPEIGDIHFNNRYFFNDDDTTLEDFMDTALHEIGHSLGLEHSRSKASLMHPTESNRFTEPQAMDIEQIQALYGSRRGGRSANEDPPQLCSLDRIDAAIADEDGNRFVLSDKFYYNLNERRPVGRLISTKWPGLPGNIEAALRYYDGRSYFFKGNKYWRFTGSRLDPGHPRLIADGFRGLPSNLDALLTDADGDIFALKGSQYWVYSVSRRRVLSGYPANVKEMGLPRFVDGALDTDNDVMVFKGDKKYQLQADGTFKPQDNEWIGCTV